MERYIVVARFATLGARNNLLPKLVGRRAPYEAGLTLRHGSLSTVAIDASGLRVAFSLNEGQIAPDSAPMAEDGTVADLRRLRDAPNVTSVRFFNARTRDWSTLSGWSEVRIP